MELVKERIGGLTTLGLVAVLIAVLFLSTILAVMMGSVDLPAGDVFHVLAYNIMKTLGIDIGGYDLWGKGVAYDIVWNVRAPRVFLAAIVGMTLALAGVVMQATVQNPLADPYILGMSSGASFGATVCIAMGITSIGSLYLGQSALALFAFVGSLISAIAVLALSSAGGRTTSVKLVLAGAIISSIIGAASSLIIVLYSNAQEMESLTYWLMGSFAAANWSKISLPLIVFIAGFIYFMIQAKDLNTMLMGDEVATSLGIDLSKKRKTYVAATALLTATAVCFCGIIGFVGLIVPHCVRALSGNNHWKLIPLSCLAGGIFLLLADLLARTVMDVGELPIGIITAFCGSPVFAYIMIRKTYAFA